MSNTKLYAMSFSKFYSNYIKKAEKKGRSKEEVDEIIIWLLGYDKANLQKQLDDNKNLEDFINAAPCINENASLITGKICGVRVEEVEDDILRHIHYLDKLVDELAKGKAMDKILRQ